MVQTARMAGAVAVAAIVALGASAQAQVKPGSQQGLGLRGAEIPPILKQTRADPYRAPATPACETIPREIKALDKALGPDVDGLKTKTTAGDMAAGYVRHMVPYRGVFRFLTGADNKDKKLQAAATAGYARRGFLRGLEAQMHCASAAETQVADLSDQLPDARVPTAEFRVTEVKVADAPPIAPPLRRPESGDTIAQEMLTPVSTAPAPLILDRPAPAPARPIPAHVVYQLVDSVSGQPIVPDGGR